MDDLQHRKIFSNQFLTQLDENIKSTTYIHKNGSRSKINVGTSNLSSGLDTHMVTILGMYTKVFQTEIVGILVGAHLVLDQHKTQTFY